MSNKDDESFTSFVNGLSIYFILCVLSVPVGLGIGQLIKYFMGS